jgi:hypothetical protein
VPNVHNMSLTAAIDVLFSVNFAVVFDFLSLCIAYSFCFTGAETEIDKIKEDSKIDREKNIDRRGPRQIGTD